MKVVIEGNTPKKYNLELGDVVLFNKNDECYMVMETAGIGFNSPNKTYSLRALRGHGGLVGDYESLEALNERFNESTYKHSKVFKKSEYGLSLFKL